MSKNESGTKMLTTIDLHQDKYKLATTTLALIMSKKMLINMEKRQETITQVPITL